MADAVFQASYSDFKIVRSRNCAQVILEVPLEQADAALDCLGGVPKPGNEIHVAVARLSSSASPVVDTSARAQRSPPLMAAGIGAETQYWPPNGTPPTPAPQARPTLGVQPDEAAKAERQREASERSSAAYRGTDAMGQAVMRAGMLPKDETFWDFMRAKGWPVDNEYDAAVVLRCEVKIDSRKEIGTDPAAYERFLALEVEYKQSQGQFAEQRA